MLVFLLSLCASSSDFGSMVTRLTSSNFQEEVKHRSNHTVYFVMFHGERCPACQMAYPEFVRAAEESAGMVKFGQVDTSVEYSLANEFNIMSIPRFYIFHSGGQRQYDGDRSARALLNVASRYIPNLSENVTEEWKDKEDLKAIVLFSTRDHAPPLWNGVSCFFENNDKDIRVGFSNNQTIHQLFGITAQPTILMIDGNTKVVYPGKNKYSDITKIANDFFNGIIPKTPTPTPPPVYVHTLQSQDEFDQQCKGKGLFCVVERAEEPSKEFEEIAKKYRNDHFKFFICGEKCPFDYLQDNVWIYHHRRDAAIKVTNSTVLGATLDRVIDGGARFQPIEKLLKPDNDDAEL